LLHVSALAWVVAFFGFALSFGPLLIGIDRRKSSARSAVA
jgi:uncharacterized protein involved in response to NO